MPQSVEDAVKEVNNSTNITSLEASQCPNTIKFYQDFLPTALGFYLLNYCRYYNFYIKKKNLESGPQCFKVQVQNILSGASNET